jgi:hypothetical protein
LSLITSFADIGSRWASRTRRLPLQRFPFSVVCRRAPEQISVAAVAHQRRDPEQIKKHISK